MNWFRLLFPPIIVLSILLRLWTLCVRKLMVAGKLLLLMMAQRMILKMLFGRSRVRTPVSGMSCNLMLVFLLRETMG